MRVAYYSSGNIGAGHIARGLALQRAFARANVSAEYRIFYASPPFQLPANLDVHVLRTPPEALKNEAAAKESETAQALREFAPDILFVDIAWFDLQHILPIPGVEPWLLLRWCHPQTLRGPFNRAFKEEHYARIIGIEPTIPFAVPEQVDPVVVANPDECHPREALRERFNVEPDAPITLVVQAGLPGERDLLIDREERRRDGHRIVVVDPSDDGLFPIAPWLPGADRIAGGAGYNLYWETRWLGLESRADLQPFRRRIDDQNPRVKLAGAFPMRENGADTLVRWLR